MLDALFALTKKLVEHIRGAGNSLDEFRRELQTSAQNYDGTYIATVARNRFYNITATRWGTNPALAPRRVYNLSSASSSEDEDPSTSQESDHLPQIHAMPGTSDGNTQSPPDSSSRTASNSEHGPSLSAQVRSDLRVDTWIKEQQRSDRDDPSEQAQTELVNEQDRFDETEQPVSDPVTHGAPVPAYAGSFESPPASLVGSSASLPEHMLRSCHDLEELLSDPIDHGATLQEDKASCASSTRSLTSNSTSPPSFMYRGCYDLRQLEDNEQSPPVPNTQNTCHQPAGEFPKPGVWPVSSRFQRERIIPRQQFRCMFSDAVNLQLANPPPQPARRLKRRELNQIAADIYFANLRRREQRERQHRQCDSIVSQEQDDCEDAIASDSDSADVSVGTHEAFDTIGWDAPMTPPGCDDLPDLIRSKTRYPHRSNYTQSERDEASKRCAKLYMSGRYPWSKCLPLVPGEEPALRTFPAKHPAPTKAQIEEATRHEAVENQRNEAISRKDIAAVKEQERFEEEAEARSWVRCQAGREEAKRTQLAQRREEDEARQTALAEEHRGRPEQAPHHFRAGRGMTQVDTPIPLNHVDSPGSRHSIDPPVVDEYSFLRFMHPSFCPPVIDELHWTDDLRHAAAGGKVQTQAQHRQDRIPRFAWNRVVPIHDPAKPRTEDRKVEADGFSLPNYPGTVKGAPWDISL